MHVLHEPLKHKPKCRVELHVHLDGALRPETIWDVMRSKGMKLPGNGSLGDLKATLKVKEPQDLQHMLAPINMYLPALVGDLEVIERISYEFVEDKAKESVAYCEARFSPHLLVSSPTPSHANGTSPDSSGGGVTVDDVVEAVLRGLARGEDHFGTKTRVLICCLRGMSDWAWDVLRLCEKYQNKGVVGIDIAGVDGTGNEEGCINNPVDIAVFKAAKEKGIHRTAHAGEAGGPICVKMSVEEYGAERIGHGYRVLEDEEIYKMCLKEKIHFEVCPHSSYLTGTIKSMLTNSKRHPVLRFVEDGASFSINTDDPTLTDTQLSEEYALLTSWGFTEAQLTRANFQAALHSFLPPEDKRELIAQLKEAYGVIDESPNEATASSSSSPSAASPTTTRTSSSPLKPSVVLGTWAERA